MRILKILTIAAIFFISSQSFAQMPQMFAPPQNFAPESDGCDNINDDVINAILVEITKKGSDYSIKNLPDCYRLNRKLILKAALIDPVQFDSAHDLLKEDDLFVRRLLKGANPAVLQYASPKLRSSKNFMERATYLSRDSLQYADPMILDNKLFMRHMIGVDSRNYIYASERLRELPEFAKMAFYDNGSLLSHAPQKIKSDKELVKIAVQSNISAFDFASDELKKDKDLLAIISKNPSIKFSEEKKEKLKEFIRKNYVIEEVKKNLGYVLTDRAKFSEKNKIIDRNYITKWHKNLNFKNSGISEEMRLITVDSRNYPILWKEDLKKYPSLIPKIEKFFHDKNIDQNTIDNLSITYFWKVKKNPETLVLNVYLLRDSKDADLGPDFSDITSLTVILIKQGKKWRASVVEVIFDSEWKVDPAYQNGHKKYIFWDLYSENKKDKKPKIIFKVEDKFREYFEVFEEQSGGKYEMVFYYDPLNELEKAESLN